MRSTSAEDTSPISVYCTTRALEHVLVNVVESPHQVAQRRAGRGDAAALLEFYQRALRGRRDPQPGRLAGMGPAERDEITRDDVDIHPIAACHLVGDRQMAAG